MKISMYVAVSMDGFIARMDGSIDWLGGIDAAANEYDYQSFYDSVDSLVMGGRTYRQIVSSHDWYYAGKPVWVYSRGAFACGIPDVFHANVPPPELTARLRQEGRKHLWVIGGGEAHSMFLREGLIDEMRIFVMPLALGEGVPLFAPTVPERRWKLTTVRQWGNNVAELRYARDA